MSKKFSYESCWSLIYFFQAEDGIRDGHVTGVQTCALPIYNGYEAGYTTDILDILLEEDVPATFFVTGHYVEQEPKLIKRMRSEERRVGKECRNGRERDE